MADFNPADYELDLFLDEGRLAEYLKTLPRGQQDAALQAAEELNRIKKENPLALFFPHKQQVAFLASKAKVKCFFGGTQAGKTSSGIADDLIQCLPTEWVPSHLRRFKFFDGEFRCRIFANNLNVIETVLFEKIRDLCPEGALLGGKWSNAYDKQLRILHFANGSQIAFFTYEQDVKAIQGATVDRIHYDEEPPRAHRNESRFRTIARGGQEIFSMTPVEGLTWTYDELWNQRGEEVGDRVWEKDNHFVIQASQDDNPALSEEDKARGLEGLSEDEKQARRHGKFVALSGLVYKSFTRDTHVVPQRPLPSNTNIVVGIDPGIRYAAAVVWAAMTPNDTMLIFEEAYLKDLTVAQVCEQIHRVNGLYDISPTSYIIDPAARNRAHQTGRSDQMEYSDHGIYTIAGQNPVLAGINRVKERLENNRLYVYDNCVEVIEELERYRWKDPSRSGEETREKTVKVRDHAIDCVRYICASRPYLPEENIPDNETSTQRMMRVDQDRGESEEMPATESGGVYF